MDVAGQVEGDKFQMEMQDPLSPTIIKSTNKEYWLYFEGNDDFEPNLLKLRGVRGTKLIDMFRIHYDGFVYSQRLYTATSNRVRYPDFFNYCYF